MGFLFGEREWLHFRFVYITCKKHGRKEEKSSLAQRLGLPKPFDLPERQSKLDLGKPLEVNTIVGDGNCLYRSISLEICGMQNHHEQVRALIVD